MKIVFKILFFINIAFVFVTLVSYINPFIHPKHFWPIATIGLLYPLWLVINVIFILFWLFVKSYKRSLLSLLTIILGWSYLISFANFKGSVPTLEDQKLHVVTFNLQGLQVVFKSKDKGIQDSLLQEMKDMIVGSSSLDIVCVQDMVSSNIPFFEKTLGFTHKHKLDKQRTMTGIFSKFPIVDKGEIAFDQSFNSCIWADIDWHGNKVRVYSMHLESNRITDDAEKMITEGITTGESTRSKLKTMFSKYKHTAVMRAQQAALINEHIQDSPYPVILAGDLNDTPQSYVYRVAARSLTDGFKKTGRGIGTTYAGGIPGLRIDYIFADQKFQVLSYETLKDRIYSDHFPVRATLILR